jgi:pimeloyl-ACP methyl ester carboxylesterase
MNTTKPETAFLAVKGGRIAYEITGSGPLVVCIPGMGDLRSSYRHLVPLLVAAGYRVVTTDLRGHGDSDTTFTSYGNQETADDIEALLDHLGSSAVVAGNSMGAAVGVLLAAKRPELIDGLALLSPFVRNGRVNPALALLMRVLLAPAFAAATWKGYLPTLNAGHKPDDFAEYLASVNAAMKRPGYARAFSRLAATLDHSAAEAALPSVHTPVVVIMGELDPDFTPDASAEAEWIGEQLDGTVVMVPDAGHYPQSQQPDATAAALTEFLARVHRA